MQQNNQQFERLKQKYQPVLSRMQQLQAQVTAIGAGSHVDLLLQQGIAQSVFPGGYPVLQGEGF